MHTSVHAHMHVHVHTQTHTRTHKTHKTHTHKTHTHKTHTHMNEYVLIYVALLLWTSVTITKVENLHFSRDSVIRWTAMHLTSPMRDETTLLYCHELSHEQALANFVLGSCEFYIISAGSYHPILMLPDKLES